MSTGLIAALCTPLDKDGSLNVGGFEAHLAQQTRHGISGVLVGGTMGLMQLQKNSTYEALVANSARLWADKGEVLVGVGDTSFARTRERIELVERHKIDGIVVLTPYFLKFSQTELVAYYNALADLAKKPIFIYLLPALTGVWLEHETVVAMSEHPNIRGIKCSVPLEWTRKLRDKITRSWRIIPAQPYLVDFLIRCGFQENLDGLFAVFPRISAAIVAAARAGEWDKAASHQRSLAQLAELLTTKYPLFPAATVLLNATGIAGNVAPAPLQPLEPAVAERFLAEPLVKQYLAEEASLR